MLGTVNHLMFWPMNSPYTGFNNDFQQKLFQKVQYSKNKKCGLISFFFGKIRRSRPLHHKKKTYVYWEWICFCWKIAFLFSIESEFEVFLSGFPVQSQILRRESKGYDNKWINKMSASAVVYESCSRWANNLIGCFIWLNGIQIGAMLFVSSLSKSSNETQSKNTLQ